MKQYMPVIMIAGLLSSSSFLQGVSVMETQNQLSERQRIASLEERVKEQERELEDIKQRLGSGSSDNENWWHALRHPIDTLEHSLTKLSSALTTAEPQVDIQERDTDIVVTVRRLPKGIKAEDITVEVHNNGRLLLISGKYHEVTQDEKGKNVVRREQSSFTIVRTLPVAVDENAVVAHLDKEKLVITLPKKNVVRKPIKVVAK